MAPVLAFVASTTLWGVREAGAQRIEERVMGREMRNAVRIEGVPQLSLLASATLTAI
jgi:hypothetical protein